MGKNQKIISISDQYLTFLQLKENGAPAFRQISIEGANEDDVARKLKELSKTFGLRKGSFTAMVSRHDVLVRFMTLPSSNVEEIKKMVALQIDKIVPYAADEVIFDVLTIGNNKDASKVMVVLVPREIVERYWRIFVKAGGIPARMSMSAWGLWLWYQRRPLDKSGIALILDLHDAAGEICICSHDHVFASRAFRFVKGGFGNSDSSVLLKETHSTIEGYIQENVGPLPTKIIIVGTRLISDDLLETLKKEYELPIERVEQAKELGVAKEASTAMMGLSGSDLAKSIDLMPKDLVEAQIKVGVKWAMIRMMVAVVLLIASVAVSGIVHIHRKRVYLEQLNEEWVQTKKQLDRMQQMKATIEMTSQALNNRVMAADIIKAVSEAAPQSISLFNMNIASDRTLMMQGIASQPADINIFQENLVRSSMFVSVRLDFVNKRTTQEGESSYFKISCQLKQR